VLKNLLRSENLKTLFCGLYTWPCCLVPIVLSPILHTEYKVILVSLLCPVQSMFFYFWFHCSSWLKWYACLNNVLEQRTCMYFTILQCSSEQICESRTKLTTHFCMFCFYCLLIVYFVLFFLSVNDRLNNVVMDCKWLIDWMDFRLFSKVQVLLLLLLILLFNFDHTFKRNTSTSMQCNDSLQQ